MDDKAAPPDANDERPDAERAPTIAATAPRGPSALLGTALTGFGMGMAEVVPGFSGGTVALVAGIYEHLIAVLRQGVAALSLLVRGRWRQALVALAAVEWPFAIVLAVGMLVALFTTASTLQGLIDDHPAEVSAVFLGLVLGAVVVAVRLLRAPGAASVAVVLVAGIATFFGLAFSPGTISDPGLLTIFGAAMIAVCAWILPGVSGSFFLLVIGVYPTVIDALTERDLVVIGVVALGCVAGLAAFSTLLNWLLLRAHDVVIASLIGLMLGSVRVLWPWPSDDGVGSPELGAPPGVESLLAVSLGLVAFALVIVFGLIESALERRAHRSAR